MQEPKSKQIQSSFVEGYNLVALGLRDETKKLKLQPGQTRGRVQGSDYSPRLDSVQGQTKINEASDELEKYCPHIYNRVFDRLGMLKKDVYTRSDAVNYPTIDKRMKRNYINL